MIKMIRDEKESVRALICRLAIALTKKYIVVTILSGDKWPKWCQLFIVLIRSSALDFVKVVQWFHHLAANLFNPHKNMWFFFTWQFLANKNLQSSTKTTKRKKKSYEQNSLECTEFN